MAVEEGVDKEEPTRGLLKPIPRSGDSAAADGEAAVASEAEPRAGWRAVGAAGDEAEAMLSTMTRWPKLDSR